MCYNEWCKIILSKIRELSKEIRKNLAATAT